MALRTSGAARSFALSGLWIAAIGFFVTRFTVTLAAHESRTGFLIAGVVPLVLGLVLAAGGVALLVGSFDPSFVRAVAVWCVAGTLAMGGLVAITLIGTASGESIRSEVVLSNFLIGGGLLGALTGLYAGRNRRHRIELRQQANRLVTINRLLRHEVLNAVAVVRGRAESIAQAEPDLVDGEEATRTILDESARIVDTVEDVKHLARANRDRLAPVDLVEAASGCVENVREAYPAVDLTLDYPDGNDVTVWADDLLVHALTPVLENAALQSEGAEPVVSVAVESGSTVGCMRITHPGSSLSPADRDTLERGEISEYDDPQTGFGLNVTRLVVEGYDGDIVTAVSPAETTIVIELPLATEPRPSPAAPGSVRSMGVDRHALLVATGAAVLAGVVMGVFVQATAGVIPVIGALYGVADPLVGWITHLFHSVVFGLIYVGLLGAATRTIDDGWPGRLGVAVSWALALWLFAAGVIMPVWLNLVGLEAPVPLLTAPALGGHLVWGFVLGIGFHFGRDRLPGR